MADLIPNRRTSKKRSPRENVDVWERKPVEPAAQKEKEQSWEVKKETVVEKERGLGWREYCADERNLVRQILVERYK